MAAAAVAGVDPINFIRSDSDVEVVMLKQIAEEAIKLSGEYRQDLAERIIQRLGKAMGKQQS